MLKGFLEELSRRAFKGGYLWVIGMVMGRLYAFGTDR